MLISIILFSILFSHGFFVFCISKNSDSYIAAVVEHVPVVDNGLNASREQAIKLMNLNMDIYENHIIKASRQGAQIIVFPEYGLYGSHFFSRDSILPYLEELPDTTEMNQMIVPCNHSSFQSSPIFQRTSCLALTYNIVVVINMGEVEYCQNAQLTENATCPQDGRFQYNTLVVFSDKGQFLAKYHKSHVYGNEPFDEPLLQKAVFFDTNFGVRFGLLICFDIMFPSPQMDLYQLGIRDIVFSSWWVNFPPLITSTQVQQATSLMRKTNLLASGIGNSYVSSGSGIYTRGHPLKIYFNPSNSPHEKLLVAIVPKLQKNDLPNDSSDFRMIEEKEWENELEYEPETKINDFIALEEYAVAIFIPSANSSANLSISYRNLECQANISVSQDFKDAQEIFGLVAYSGPYGFLKNIEMCAFLKCYSADTCANQNYPIMQSAARFTSFSIRALSFNNTMSTLPLVAQTDIELLDVKDFDVADHSIRSNGHYFKDKTLLNLSVFSLQWNDEKKSLSHELFS